ncbi:MAG: hypothetical protein DMF73_04700 [Acidobacteria bacterium]|nr:MAG: hypothetical protein DMF73_04700 [Acidobacteriota bacterium]
MGAVPATLVAVGTIVTIPPLGALVAGPIVAALAGAGAATSGIIVALAGMKGDIWQTTAVVEVV